MLGTRAGYQHRMPTAPSYTSQYGNLSKVNLGVGYIDAAPTSAKNFNGETIILSRRRRLAGYQTTIEEKVSKCSISNLFGLKLIWILMGRTRTQRSY